MTELARRCTDPHIYPAEATGISFEERRVILLARYTERELEHDLENKIREHLNACVSCAEFVRELQDAEAFRPDLGEVIYASCPSSFHLDQYVSGKLPPSEKAKISEHLAECSLCKEETNWLRNTAEVPAAEDMAPARLPGARGALLQYAAIAAAVCFMALSLFLLSQRASISGTEERLRAAAVVKGPEHINYAALRKASPGLPEKMNGVYEKGVEALKRQSYQEAIRHLEIVATSHPDHSAAIYLLGYSYYQMHEPEKAFELCDRAEKMTPHSLERCLSLVNIALKTGHFARAIEEIGGLHHEAPYHPEVKATYERIVAITRGRAVRL